MRMAEMKDLTISAPPITLLIADDEEMNVVILSRRLRREGYATIDASDGQDAVTKIRNLAKDGLPFAVLMDINMPIMNGIEATRIIKSEFKDLPVIAVTACVVDSFDYKGFGFDHLCKKPIDFVELINKIESCRC
jgi:CheY-like chemotaxis protein